MGLVLCAACARNVLPRRDGSCPSCGASTAGAVAVAVERRDPDAAAAD